MQEIRYLCLSFWKEMFFLKVFLVLLVRACVCLCGCMFLCTYHSTIKLYIFWFIEVLLLLRTCFSCAPISPVAYKPTQKSYLKSDKPRAYLPDFTANYRGTGIIYFASEMNTSLNDPQFFCARLCSIALTSFVNHLE